jgi:hypothetical protein
MTRPEQRARPNRARWPLLAGLLAFLAVATVVGVRDAYVPAPEVDVCLDGSTTCDAWEGDEYQLDEVNPANVALAGGIAAVIAALATIVIREMLPKSRGASSSQAEPPVSP